MEMETWNVTLKNYRMLEKSFKLFLFLVLQLSLGVCFAISESLVERY